MSLALDALFGHVGPLHLAAGKVSDAEFQLYRVGVVLCGVLLAVLAVARIGASTAARLASGVLGIILLGYGFYLFFLIGDGQLTEVYTFLFMLPLLMVGYLLYDRAMTREYDRAARAQIDAEKAIRRAEAATHVPAERPGEAETQGPAEAERAVETRRAVEPE